MTKDKAIWHLPMLALLAWRNLWRNRLRTSIMVCAMVFGLVGVVVMIGFMTGMYANMIDNAVAWQTSHLQVHNKDYLLDPDINSRISAPEPVLARLAELPEVQGVSARFLVQGMLASPRASRGIRINGVDPAAEAKVTPIAEHITEGDWLDIAGRHPIVISQKTASRLKLRLGSKVVLTFSNADKAVSGAAFRVAGLYRSPSCTFDEANAYVRRKDLTLLAGLDGVHEIAIRLSNSDSLDNSRARAVAKALSSDLAPQDRVRDWQQIQPMLATIIAQMGTSNAVILVIFISALGLGITNIMLMAVFERTREFGVLMAIGMVKPKIMGLILLESLLLGLTGAFLGLLLSVMVIALLGKTGIPLGSMADGLGAFGVSTTLYPQVAIDQYLLTLAMVVVASLLAALYPARQIIKQRPVDAMAQKH
ncbi:FtsX-like permease family protein [Shewanella sp. Isolate7]|uniref:ABC transporter permease n=1 Tax=Shewanella sp. Isolate7 TaxID=2908528 RepID=UPI001EFC5C03|nr:FtsX-like permease family protein [Shewanella sp. Isolate7]MCG9719837.1 ABC transporter permease [Shewanella sp. Isolate7]